MKTLGTLIKLQKSLVDEQRRMLTDLQNILDRIDHEIVELTVAQAREEGVVRDAEPVARQTFSLFIMTVKARLERLMAAKQQAVEEVEKAREKLAELFEAQKRYEIISEQREAAALAEENRQEQMELDETAAQGHQRRKREE